MLSWLCRLHFGANELLVKSVQESMSFFEHNDFVTAGSTVRIPGIWGGATMRRHESHGAIFTGSLRAALLARRVQ
jgi:hypothetical protein